MALHQLVYRIGPRRAKKGAGITELPFGVINNPCVAPLARFKQKNTGVEPFGRKVAGRGTFCQYACIVKTCRLTLCWPVSVVNMSVGLMSVVQMSFGQMYLLSFKCLSVKGLLVKCQ
jgi:hypothetical protein